MHTVTYPEQTYDPTNDPLLNPTSLPSNMPTKIPTQNPTDTPSETPSLIPTTDPSSNPTATPTVVPSFNPTYAPTVVPSINPTYTPTGVPSINPTMNPTSPSMNPSKSPTMEPTMQPTSENNCDEDDDYGKIIVSFAYTTKQSMVHTNIINIVIYNATESLMESKIESLSDCTISTYIINVVSHISDTANSNITITICSDCSGTEITNQLKDKFIEIMENEQDILIPSEDSISIEYDIIVVGEGTVRVVETTRSQNTSSPKHSEKNNGDNLIIIGISVSILMIIIVITLCCAAPKIKRIMASSKNVTNTNETKLTEIQMNERRKTNDANEGEMEETMKRRKTSTEKMYENVANVTPVGINENVNTTKHDSDDDLSSSPSRALATPRNDEIATPREFIENKDNDDNEEDMIYEDYERQGTPRIDSNTKLEDNVSMVSVASTSGTFGHAVLPKDKTPRQWM